MRIAVLAVLAVVSGCAAVSSLGGGSPHFTPSAADDAQKMALQSRAASDAADSACAPQLARSPGFEEERAVGTDLAISFAARLGHFYLEGASELAERKAITLPEGNKNAVSARVAVVGRHLARFSARPDLPWVFGVIENGTPNSFSTPGGYVFITTGLLKKLTNEAQLAGVLGHEISHVQKKDMLKRYVSAIHKQCIAAKYAEAMIKAGGLQSPSVDQMALFARQFDGNLDLESSDGSFKHFLLSAVMSISMMGSDQATEFAHDKAALELLSFAGYDASEYEKFLANSPMPQHPAGAERATRLQALREGELKDIAIGTAKPDLSKLLAP